MNNKITNPSGKVFTFSTIGLQFALTILLFLYGGYKLDEYYGLGPLLLITGAFVGFATGLYNLIRNLRDLEKKVNESSAEQKSPGNKWSTGSH